MKTDDFLLEIGTEELPPKSLPAFLKHLKTGFEAGLSDNLLGFDEVLVFATPRRLAVQVMGLAIRQQDQEVEKRGPAVKAAFDGDGKPTNAALGFAKGLGVSIDQLDRLETEKGDYLLYKSTQAGLDAVAVLPDITRKVISSLPIDRRMKWGDSKEEFVRPVHWLVMMLGAEPLDAQLLGLKAGRISIGHRFMSPAPIELKHPKDYVSALAKAKVSVCFDERRSCIAEQLEKAAKKTKGELVLDESLLDEVTGLVEWPVVLVGQFESEFLEVPEEALVSAMSKHQKYFHLLDKKGKLLPLFLTVCNIESSRPEAVTSGNEKVIRARLADARFFFEQDCKTSLEAQLPKLDKLIFQAELGSYKEKCQRISAVAGYLANELDVSGEDAKRAGLLCKADLTSAMVNEFPDLQGVMGGYYARVNRESDAVAQAIREHYQPVQAGGNIPSTTIGQCVALADKLDTLIGVFGIGQPPSGSKDPFALRRAATGVIRIVLEACLELNLLAILKESASQYQVQVASRQFKVASLFDYLLDRLQFWYQEKGIPADVFRAVRASHDQMDNLIATDKKIRVLNEFRAGPDTQDLVEVNKRVANILKGIDLDALDDTDAGLFENDAESVLYKEVETRASQIASLIDKDEYKKVFASLAALQPAIDAYFDKVMVMCEDESLKQNRLATLKSLRNLFLSVADLSLLQI